MSKKARNYMRRGDKVRMKDGELLTVRSLEFREFCAEERVGYIPKRDIDKIESLNHKRGGSEQPQGDSSPKGINEGSTVKEASCRKP